MDVSIPEGMRRKGRPLDPCFTHEESLYIRFPTENPVASDIRLPVQSVNRSKYSTPEWTQLPHYKDSYVGALKVGQLPAPLFSTGGREFRIGLYHEPEDLNYAHSELKVLKEGEADHGRTKINKAVKLEIRNEIVNHVEIVLRPQQ